MKKNILFQIVILIFSTTVFAQENTKIAQTGFQFLTVGTDARATGLGEAYTTFEGSSNSLFYNPAGLARIQSPVEFSVNRMSWIADIAYLSGTVGLSIADGDYGIFGLSFNYVDYGEFLFTRVANSYVDSDGDITKGYVDVEGAQPYAFSIGLGYGKELSDKFSIGGQIKYVVQNLGDSYLPSEQATNQYVPGEIKNYEVGVLAFDFGTLYKTGFKSLAFGMSVRNFAQEVKFEKEGFQLPLVFRIGLSMDLTDFYEELKEDHSLMLSVDAAHPRSHPEFIAVGLEYTFLKILAIRGGYVSGQDLYDITAGFGLKYMGVDFNYSFTPIEYFEDVHRLSLGFAM